jgi:hypothetical protein
VKKVIIILLILNCGCIAPKPKTIKEPLIPKNTPIEIYARDEIVIEFEKKGPLNIP